MSNLPPGVTQRMIDEAYGWDAPCAVCGCAEAECVCPECSHCGTVGDPRCYDEHGMEHTPEQLEMARLNARTDEEGSHPHTEDGESW